MSMRTRTDKKLAIFEIEDATPEFAAGCKQFGGVAKRLGYKHWRLMSQRARDAVQRIQARLESDDVWLVQWFDGKGVKRPVSILAIHSKRPDDSAPCGNCGAEQAPRSVDGHLVLTMAPAVAELWKQQCNPAQLTILGHRTYLKGELRSLLCAIDPERGPAAFLWEELR